MLSVTRFLDDEAIEKIKALSVGGKFESDLVFLRRNFCSTTTPYKVQLTIKKITKVSILFRLKRAIAVAITAFLREIKG